MCRSRSEGGQRCYAHARKSFDKAFLAYSAAVEKGDRVEIQRLQERATSSGVQFGTTPEGADVLRLRAAAAMSIGRADRAGWYDSMARQGTILRESNDAVRVAAQEHRLRKMAQSVVSQAHSVASHAHMPHLPQMPHLPHRGHVAPVAAAPVAGVVAPELISA